MIQGYGNTTNVHNRLLALSKHVAANADDNNMSDSHKLVLSRVNKNIKEVLSSISPQRFIKLIYANTASHKTSLVIPFSAPAIIDAFKKDDHVMIGNLGFCKGKVSMIEVEAPKSVQEIADCFTKIAELNDEYNTKEYALILFAGEKSERFIVKKWSWWNPKIKANPFIETPDGEKMISVGILAHTHPFGDAIPSKNDCEALLKYKKLFNQNFSVLATHNKWCLFDNNRSFTPTDAFLPLEYLY